MNNDYSNDNYNYDGGQEHSTYNDYGSTYNHNGTTYNGYGEPVNTSTAYATVALTIGIMSLVFCGFLVIPQIVAIVLAIISIKKKEVAKGRQVGAIVTAAISLVTTFLLYIVIIVAFRSAMTGIGMGLDDLGMLEEYMEYEHFDSFYDESYDEYSWDITYDMVGYKFQADDGSMIHFNWDDSFLWYLDDADHTDNYYYGTYEIYEAADAEYMLTTELTEYGVTQEELDDYWARNADSEIYCKDNLTVLVLETEYMIVDGTESDEFQETKCYYGFYHDGVFDAVKMDSANTVLFKKAGDSDY